MRDIVGAGTAKTAAGDVKVFFARNPDADCSFKPVAGDIQAEFLENLSADFLLKTSYGDAYTDFPVTLLPITSSATERRCLLLRFIRRNFEWSEERSRF